VAERTAVNTVDRKIVVAAVRDTGSLVICKIATDLAGSLPLMPGATVGGIEQFKSVALLGKIKA
jgi:hypothetical protein